MGPPSSMTIPDGSGPLRPSASTKYSWSASAPGTARRGRYGKTSANKQGEKKLAAFLLTLPTLEAAWRKLVNPGQHRAYPLTLNRTWLSHRGTQLYQLPLDGGDNLSRKPTCLVTGRCNCSRRSIQQV